ncbi:YfcE family phosphodiesterase [Aeoliella sp. ICT_H6.2]|uniref:Phosphoesterase n=1 Tax=Aeoliella straminimaris TaxID=2954799 RepID=A0A9X2JF27_9BACT|nr:YfcE family phosphodiesterase [Aeoliella straminimaris]MCO6043615.1 YfcE family phosphodiesterase [Aeoliella straminimaris]
MRLGIVSDSHGHTDHTRPAIRLLESLQVDAVLHCGDIGSGEVVKMFAAWPTHFVFGNCDYDQSGLAKAIEDAGQHCHGLFGDLEFEGTRIALLHSHERNRFQSVLDNPVYRAVCYGHTHVAEKLEHNGKLVLNPGALYRAAKHSIAILDVPQCEAEIIEL